jgi:AcrR family transcriptional regulator
MAEGKKTKAAIAAAYIQLCEEKEWAKISVQDIALRTGINRQTFYYHFPDKKTLLRWVYLNDSLRYLAADEVSLDNWEEQALKMLKTMQEKSVFYHNTLAGERDILMNEFFQVVQEVFKQLFQQVDEEHVLSTQDIQFYSRFFSFGCSGILEAWIRGNFQETPLDIATQLLRLAQDIEVYTYRIYQRNEE